MSSQRKYTCVIVGLLLLVPIICLCGCYYGLAEQEINASILEWQVQNRLDAIYLQVTKIPINSVSLIQENKPQTGQGGTLSCVYGGATQVYSSNRPFSEVLNDYELSFHNSGWKQKTVPSIDNDTKQDTVFYQSDMYLIVVISEGKPKELDVEASYIIYFDFDQCGEFWPTWRRSS